MSDATVAPQGTDPASVIQPDAAKPPVKVDAEPRVDMTPAQLKARLEEERVKGEKRAAEALAADLGVSVPDAKRLISEAKAKEDASKSEVQKLAEEKANLERQLGDFATYKQTVENRAALEFGSLTDTQRAAVESIAGPDPAKRLATIDALKPTWAQAQQAQADAIKAVQAQAQEAAVAAAKAAEEAKKKEPPPPLAAPATTAPGGAPPPAVAPSDENMLLAYEQLEKTNPMRAAAIMADPVSATAIQRARKARGNA